MLFNGRDGEWRAEVIEAGKRGGALGCVARTRDQGAPPDLWLMFAPIRKQRTDIIVEKAVELGVARIRPVLTEFTRAERWRADKQRAHAIEAAEQCGITWVPQVDDSARLSALLDNWDADRRILFCDESLLGAASSLAGLPRGPWAVLIGPEGGFSDAERERLRALPVAHPVSLGPRILRAETAAIAALTLWQSALGDW